MTDVPLDHDRMTRVDGYHEVQEILRSSGFWPSMFTRVSGPLLDGTLMTLSVEDHLQRRRTEVVLFSRAQLMDYELATVVPALREQLEAAFDAGDAQPTVEIMEIMRSALLRVTAKVVGVDGLTTSADVEDLRDLAEHFGNGSSAEWVVDDPEAVVAASVAAKDEFCHRFFRPALQRRRDLIAQVGEGLRPDTDLPNDLLTLLLGAYFEWDDEQLLRELIFYVTASANTTTHLAPHVLREVLEHLDRHPDERTQVGRLGYLQRLVSEGLRLHPTVPALIRRAERDVTLSTGRTFRAGEQLLLDLNACNRDAAVFGPTADRFDPGRELPARTTAYGLAFGDGAHTCLGRQVAVGAGNGSAERDDLPAGVLTRMLREVLRYRPQLDPTQPPVFRENTLTQRYARFPVVLTDHPQPTEDQCPMEVRG